MQSTNVSRRARSLTRASWGTKSRSGEEVARRIQDLVIRNAKLQTKNMISETKLKYKRDLESKRLAEVIQKAVDKLDEIKGAAQKDINDAVDHSQHQLPLLHKACSDRAEVLKNLLTRPNSSPDSELAAILDEMEAELNQADKSLSSATEFHLTTSPEMVEYYRMLSASKKPMYVRQSGLAASDVKLAYIPAASLVGSTRKTVTLIATPSQRAPCFDKLLTATLEGLDEKFAANGDDQKAHIRGVVMPLNDDSGSAKITFARVPLDGDYLVKVLMNGEPVSNSPMIVHLAASAWGDSSASGNNISQKVHLNETSTNIQGRSLGGDVELSTKANGCTSLSILASRACWRSGSPNRAAQSAAVAVASKRVLTGVGSVRSKSNEGGGNAVSTGTIKRR